jgi:hypothetical protein
MARNHQFDEQDRRIHAESEMMIARMIANRDQLESFHRDARGRRKTNYGELLKSADQTLFDFRSSHEVFTDHLIAGGVLPESKRGRPVLENDTRTNAQKLGVQDNSPILAGLHQGNQPPAGARQVSPGVKFVLGQQGDQPVGGASPGETEGVTGPEPRVAGVRKKSLNIGMPQGMAQGIPQAIAHGGSDDPEQGVAGAAAKGFAGGLMAGVQMNLGQEAGQSEPVEPEAGRDVSDGPAKKHDARVRNADGLTLRDLTAPAAGEDPLPGTTQPLVMDAIDALQGKPPMRVAMNPAHVAGLKELEGQQEDGLESEGGHYGR